MSTLHESRFRGTAQLVVPEAARAPQMLFGTASDLASRTQETTQRVLTEELVVPDGAAGAARAPRTLAEEEIEEADATLTVFDNTITVRGFFAARAGAMHATCAGGVLRWRGADESGALRLDASSFRLVRGGGDPADTFAGCLQTPHRHAAGAREWHFTHLEQDAHVTTTARHGGRATVKRRAVGLAGAAVVIFKADGLRSAIRELRLPPGMRVTVARAPPEPPSAGDTEAEATSALHLEGLPESPRRAAGWFERSRKVRVQLQ